jgi:hypothetical protein
LDDDSFVAECSTHDYAARIVAAMNAAEGTGEQRCVVCGGKFIGKHDCPGGATGGFAAEPARKAVCGTCGGSGETEEDATGALGYVVKKPCPDCAGGRPTR